MKFDLKITHLGKTDKKEEKDVYQLVFKTYNAEIQGKFERSEVRDLIQQLDNAII